MCGRGLALVSGALLLLGGACEAPPPPIEAHQAELNPDERRARLTQIRDAAAAAGMTQGWMLGGIANAETGLAHCWSEATWACQGPNSADCAGGPVIAGAGDGPCSIREGGLGLFQFDGGNFDETLARDGEAILTINGNVSRAVWFVTDMVRRSVYVDGVDTDEQAIEWMNGVRIDNGRWDAWIRTVTHYYNGCRPTAGCFSQRYNHYLSNTVSVYNEMGETFWAEAGGEWLAEFVGQSFPLASAPFELAPGASQSGTIEMRNAGRETWRPGEVFLSTTQPRGGASPLAGPDWPSPARAATVEAPVARGEVGTFRFTVVAPTEAGDYPQFFNLEREGVEFFAVPGDGFLQVRVTVNSEDCPAGVGAAWICDGSARRRCLRESVETEACDFGCLNDGRGAVCASPPNDRDGDGFLPGEDCNDSDATIFPGAEDRCDGIDSNCDGVDGEVGGEVCAGDAGLGGADRLGSGGCAAGGRASLLWLLALLLFVRVRRA
ncbi:MAG: putative metal-binding motif-containing protein [Myxococcota bacterium]